MLQALPRLVPWALWAVLEVEVSLHSPPPLLGEEVMEEVMGEAWATSDLFPPPPRLSMAGESLPKGTFEGHVYCLSTGSLVFSRVFQVKVLIH